jgi:hypothetical protein
VAANVPDPVMFLRLMRSLLAPNGLISIVTGYHPDQFAVNMFEYINHDHLTYLSVTSSAKIAEMAGLRLISARRVEHKGGSIHLLFSPQDSDVPPDESVSQLQQREAWLGIDSFTFFKEIEDRVKLLGEATRNLIQQIGNLGFAGIGASISTTHLLHEFSIGHLVTRLFDDDPNKIGRYSPGFGIEVSPLDDLGHDEYDTAVLLAWQHKTKLLSRIRETAFQGHVLIPLPRPTIVEIG